MGVVRFAFAAAQGPKPSHEYPTDAFRCPPRVGRDKCRHAGHSALVMGRRSPRERKLGHDVACFEAMGHRGAV